MRFIRVLIVPFVLLGLSLGVAYLTRASWRPWVEALRQPPIPLATAYRPATSSSGVRSLPISTTTSSTKPRRPATSTVPIVTTVDPFLFEGARSAEANLAVPFLLQAPNQNWDMPYQEACEEASLLMVQNFLGGRTTDFAPAEGDKLLLNLISYETNAGDPPDVTLRRIGEIAQARYGLHPVLKTVSSMEPVKNAIANGYPVILPASGKALKNPNFHNGGPPYHMLVAKGYLSDGRILTNDPGTRKGKNFVYEPTVLLGAIHDWNDGDVPQGEKVVLVLLP
jgi:hypothetical protein